MSRRTCRIGEGAGLRRIHGGPGRRPPACDAALEAVGVHHRCARKVRSGGARRRSAGARHLGQHPSLRARHRRTLPLADAGDVAG